MADHTWESAQLLGSTEDSMEAQKDTSMDHNQAALPQLHSSHGGSLPLQVGHRQELRATGSSDLIPKLQLVMLERIFQLCKKVIRKKNCSDFTATSALLQSILFQQVQTQGPNNNGSTPSV